MDIPTSSYVYYADRPDVQTQALLEVFKKDPLPNLDDETLKVLQETPLNLPKVILPQIAKIEDIEIPGPNGAIPTRLYFPKSEEAVLPVVVFFHGGGWVLGTLDEYDYICQSICHKTPCIVASVDYRLAPQYKFPKPLEDCYAATEWIYQNISQVGGDSKRFAVCGDSAGGNLAAAVTLKARDEGSIDIAYQVLIFPVLEDNFETNSYKKFAKDYFLTRDVMKFFWKAYLTKPEDGQSPYAAPLKATNLSGLPPALVVLANFDPLLDEGLAYASRLKTAKVTVELKRYETIHGFINFQNDLDVADMGLSEIATALKKQLSPN